jgi:hypothetical protein
MAWSLLLLFVCADYGINGPARAGSLDMKDPRRSSNMPMLGQSMRQSSMGRQQQQQGFVTRQEASCCAFAVAPLFAALLLDDWSAHHLHPHYSRQL